MNINLSEMQEKDVISIKSGMNYGHIIDALIDSEGKIVSFTCQNKKIFRNAKTPEITFLFSDIEKLGKDVILVNV